MPLSSSVVYAAPAPFSRYGPYAPARGPELAPWANATTALAALRALFIEAGLDAAHLGSARWNPLADVIPHGARVLVKPNWVLHHNLAGLGLDCVVTHTSVLEAVLHYVAKTEPQSIVVGDAPVQGCDFASLMEACGIPAMADRFARYGVEITIADFRRTIQPDARLGGRATQACRPLSRYILFDLGTDSALEPVTTPDSRFRVTMYDPDLLARTHRCGRHQYLIAREAIEADVVLNVPKLKTHKKAGITGALKNLVGINGHKEYLPHHRKGGSGRDGDCYDGYSPLKEVVEDLLDATNRARGSARRRMLAQAVRAGSFLGRTLGGNDNYEGAWHGNDTVWRTVLDLQRVLHYGREDGTLDSQVQRKVLTITDAIVGGDGDGPLAPAPVPLGMMTFGTNPAAVEWAHAILMGLNPASLALTRGAFEPHKYPIASFAPDRISVRVDGRVLRLEQLYKEYGRAFRVPSGWAGHCERGADGEDDGEDPRWQPRSEERP